MAVLAYKKVAAQNGSSNVFCFTLEYDVSGRTITFYSRIRCSWSSAPFYQWTISNSLTVAGSSVSGGSPWAASDWVSSSTTIGGTAYKLCYTAASKSYTAGGAAVTVSASTSVTIGGTANYLPTKGTHGASGSYSFAATAVWNDVNVLNPAGTQDYASGYFDLYTSENDSWRYNLTNEDSDMTHTIGTYFQVQNIRPYYDYYELDYVSGHDSTPATGAYRKTFDTADEVLTIKMKYKSFTLTINPNGGSYNGTTNNTTVTQAFNTSYQLGYPTRTGYLFSHWVASRASNFDQVGATVNTYNNNGNGATVTTWLQIESSSGTNMDVLQIVTNGSASPGAGGFYQAYGTAANHTYIQIYRLKVPVGYTVSYANNSMGDNPVVEALTDMSGTGNWKTYIFRLRTSGSGSFSTSGFIYLNGSNNTSVTWYMADAQVWDVTDGTYRAHANGIYRYDYAASNCTLTAQWEPNRYFISYNANGGSGSMSNSDHYYGSSKNLTANAYTREGYQFKGWATSSGGSVVYTDGQSVSNLTSGLGETITLYAVWDMSKAYLDLNGVLDGEWVNSLGDYGVTDVMINGAIVSRNLTDYWVEHFAGTTYAFTNIRPNPGYVFNGLWAGSYGGVIGTETVSTDLSFSTAPPYQLNLEGVVNNPNSISLSWSAQGINITNYKLYANNQVIYDGTDTSYELEATDNTYYSFYLTATNIGGTTESSYVYLRTPSSQKEAWVRVLTSEAPIEMPEDLTLLEYIASPEAGRIQTRDRFNDNVTTLEITWNDVETEQNMGSYCYYFGVKDGYYTVQGQSTTYQAVEGRKDVITLESIDVTDYPDPSLGVTGIRVSVNITMRINGQYISTVSTSYSGSSAPSYSVFMLFATSADSYATHCTGAQIHRYNEYYPVADNESGLLYFADETGYPLDGSDGGQIFYPGPIREQETNVTSEWQLGKMWFKNNENTWVRVKQFTLIGE